MTTMKMDDTKSKLGLKRKAQPRSRMSSKQAPLDNPFRFASLPPELRNMIYDLVLVCDRPIGVKYMYNRRRSPDGSRSRCQVSSKVAIYRPGSCYKYTSALGLKGASILRVCRILASEATPIFYGPNKFIFGNTTAMIKGMLEMGSQAKLLRHVELVIGSGPALQNAFELFTDVKQLQSFEVPVARIAVKNIIKANRSLFTRDLVAFIEVDAEEAKRRRRFDMIQLVPSGGYNLDQTLKWYDTEGGSTNEKLEEVKLEWEKDLIKQGVLLPIVTGEKTA